MKRNTVVVLFIFVLFAVLLGAVLTDSLSDHYLLISLCLAGAAILPFYIRFERRAPSTREMVIIASLAAIAAVSRVPFASIPSVQPTSFVIIVSSLVFGSEAGLMIGSMAALVSNLFLGEGPWTPWQMFCWGAMGYTAGLLRSTCVMKTKAGRALFGFGWGFLFGWLMNLSFVLTYAGDLTLASFAAAYASSFYFDLAHALCNALFLLLFSTSWLRLLMRYKIKYGI